MLCYLTASVSLCQATIHVTFFVSLPLWPVDHGFWQSMVKLRDTGGGSGSYSFISGWIQLFYPYLASGRENRSMRPWNQMFFDGPQLDEFPPISSSAPVDWDYYGQAHNMHFHAGFAGMVQDPQTGEIMPVLAGRFHTTRLKIVKVA